MQDLQMQACKKAALFLGGMGTFLVKHMFCFEQKKPRRCVGR